MTRNNHYVNDARHGSRRAPLPAEFLKKRDPVVDMRGLGERELRRRSVAEYDWSGDIVYRAIVQMYATVLSVVRGSSSLGRGLQ